MHFQSAIVSRGRLGAIASLALLSLTLWSCQPGAKTAVKQHPTYPVRGTLFVNDKPAPGVKVVLEADPPLTQPAQSRGGTMPMGTVDEKGEYIIQTYSAGDGAPAAKYNIKLTAPLIPVRITRGDREEVDRLNEEYLDAKKNASKDKQFTFEVKETDSKGPPQEIPAIKLTVEGFEETAPKQVEPQQPAPAENK